MYICIDCGDEFGTRRTRNTKICPQCLGRRGGNHKKPLQPKVEKLHKAGYYYYDYPMLTDEEKQLLPDDSRIILVHRLVMAKKLGRPLHKGEVVMHIDGNKINNNPDNLMIGDSETNSRQHWEARIEAERWKSISVLLLGLIGD